MNSEDGLEVNDFINRLAVSLARHVKSHKQVPHSFCLLLANKKAGASISGDMDMLLIRQLLEEAENEQGETKQ